MTRIGIRLRMPVAITMAALFVVACGGGEAVDPPGRPVMVVQPQPADPAANVFPGEVRARHEVVLAFRLGGKVVSRSVDVGDAVGEGQVLAALDPQDVALQEDSARAALRSAEADLAVAEAEYERFAALAGRQLVSRSLLDNAGNALAAARAQHSRAVAQLEIARNQSAYTGLHSPGRGVVAQRHVEAGQVVASGQPVFTVAMDGEREVVISVPEQRRAEFVPGREVMVELWSRPGQPVPGEVRERAPSADPGARTYAVRVAFDAEALGAELGQSARVHVPANGGPLLSLPLSAVSAEDGHAYVWRVDPGDATIHRQPVGVARFGSTHVSVTDGVGADDWVVLAGVHLLREGQRVVAVDRDNRPVVLPQTQP